MDLTTPALLFPAISLLLLAYTNRFLTLALSAWEIKLSIGELELQLSDMEGKGTKKTPQERR